MIVIFYMINLFILIIIILKVILRISFLLVGNFKKFILTVDKNET